MTRLLLASRSPARLSILRKAGVKPLVEVSTVDEDAVLREAFGAYGELSSDDVALLLARAKAEDVASAQPESTDVIVLGCDSVLDLNGDTLGKPTDDAEAIQLWKIMRGTTGTLHTGHWLIDLRDQASGGTGATLGATASTLVHFADVTDEEITAYVASGEPRDVAGGFTIDGRGGWFVDGIEGDHNTVIGLSLPVLRRLLTDINVTITDLWSTTD